MQPLTKNKDENQKQPHTIRIAILAEEPLGWGSGKHYFPIILHNYSWTIKNNFYKFIVDYIYDKDIIQGKLNTSQYNVLLVPGGGVGDGESIVKGITFLPGVKKWKQNISSFIQNGGGYVGICGGTALLTNLQTGNPKKPQTFLEKLYNKSSVGASCVSSYYNTLAFPLFYLFQNKHPEKIGATAYVFSFAPGETNDGIRFYSGGVPIDFQINTNHPIFSDLNKKTERIRWWGGPALFVPKKPDRKVQILAKYPIKDLSQQETTRIYAWRYIGGIRGLIRAILESFRLIKKEKTSMKNLFLNTYFLAGDWKVTDKIIDLDYSDKTAITAEIYPNKNNGRILLCTAHPEYMIWWDGHIQEMSSSGFNCLATGLHKWKNIRPLSKTMVDELTHTWWIVRRFVAWAAKVPDDQLPPIKKDNTNANEQLRLSNSIIWDGSIINQIKNI